MHGMILKAIERFSRDTYGDELWAEVVRDAALDDPSFEAMLFYEDDIFESALAALCRRLHQSEAAVLEDVGTYLVSHAKTEGIRRLLRFGGITFEEFLLSLDELPYRVRLAVDDLILPALSLQRIAPQEYVLTLSQSRIGWGHVLIGLLQAMADDYGALVILSHEGRIAPEAERIGITLVEKAFSEGRSFELGATVC